MTKRVDLRKYGPRPKSVGPLPVGVPVHADRVNFGPEEASPPVDMTALPPERREEFASAVRGLRAQQSRPASPRAAEPPPPPAPPPSSTSAPGAGGELKPTNCPHCGWDQTVADPDDFDDEDRLNYVLAARPGARARFTKTYPLFGGRLRVTLRTLSSREGDVCLRQARADMDAGRVQNVAEFLQAVNEYRLALSLARLESDGPPIELPGLDDYDVGDLPPGETAARPVLDYLLAEVLDSEVVFRAAYDAFQRFQRTANKLAQRASDADFYKATGGQP